ncbi:hypothetical protein G6031_16120 [Dietzia sp. CQ4]|uniref:hypothetical protein n=1 Tax=Dietzia TaxID=37914 RepID=UPI0015FB9F09|nr:MULTISPECIES: hypothetical protein [Dietzia]MBB1035900.1 hypothetical protein [Dietzia sp. CQ4]MBB1039256.1 hypothetical protein [Dietzia natronolimnaea]
MTTHSPGKLAAATLALATATSLAAAPAHAAPVPDGHVAYVAQASGSADGGSLDNPIVGAGLIILAGVGVSIALAVGAGVAGGAFPLPQIPGLPS